MLCVCILMYFDVQWRHEFAFVWRIKFALMYVLSYVKSLYNKTVVFPDIIARNKKNKNKKWWSIKWTRIKIGVVFLRWKNLGTTKLKFSLEVGGYTWQIKKHALVCNMLSYHLVLPNFTHWAFKKHSKCQNGLWTRVAILKKMVV